MSIQAIRPRLSFVSAAVSAGILSYFSAVKMHRAICNVIYLAIISRYLCLRSYVVSFFSIARNTHCTSRIFTSFSDFNTATKTIRENYQKLSIPMTRDCISCYNYKGIRIRYKVQIQKIRRVLMKVE